MKTKLTYIEKQQRKFNFGNFQKELATSTMKKMTNKSVLLLLLFSLSSFWGQAQKNESREFLDAILAQMIPLGEGVSMSKFPVSLGEYKQVLRIMKGSPDEKLRGIEDARCQTQDFAEKMYRSWYADEYIPCLFSSAKESTLYDSYPMAGLDRAVITQFFGYLEELHRIHYPNAKRLRFRLPLVAEWEKAAHQGPEGIGYPLRDPNTQKALCNYFEVPQTWIHYNMRHQDYRIEIPFDGYVSDLLSAGSTLQLSPRDQYAPNAQGFYDVYGNAAEMMHEDGQTRGGTCLSTAYDILHSAKMESEQYPLVIGFRVVISNK